MHDQTFYNIGKKLNKAQCEGLASKVVEIRDDIGIKNADLFYMVEPFAREQLTEKAIKVHIDECKVPEGTSISKNLYQIKKGWAKDQRGKYLAWMSCYHFDDYTVLCDDFNIPKKQYNGAPRLKGCSKQAIASFEAAMSRKNRQPHHEIATEKELEAAPVLTRFQTVSSSQRSIANSEFAFYAQLANYHTRLEEEQVRVFLDSKESFSWWQIAGEAGQGKSRLALQIADEYAVKHNWMTGFLTDFSSKNLSRIKDWSPRRPALIIIDNAVRKEARSTLLKLIKKFAPNTDHKSHVKMRILVLSRTPFDLEFQHSYDTDNHALLGRAQWHDDLSPQTYFSAVARKTFYDNHGALVLEDLSFDELRKMGRSWAELVRKTTLTPAQEIAFDEFLGLDLDQSDISTELHRPLFALLAAELVIRDQMIDDSQRKFELLLREVLDREAIEHFGGVNPIRVKTTKKQQNTAYLANILEELPLHNLDDLEPSVSALISDRPKDLRNAAKLLGVDLSSLATGNISTLRGREPHLLAEFQVVDAFSSASYRYLQDQCRSADLKHVGRLNSLIEAAWQIDAEQVVYFLGRVIQDFPDHPSTVIMVTTVPTSHHLQNLWLDEFGYFLRLAFENQSPDLAASILDSMLSAVEIRTDASCTWQSSDLLAQYIGELLDRGFTEECQNLVDQTYEFFVADPGNRDRARAYTDILIALLVTLIKPRWSDSDKDVRRMERLSDSDHLAGWHHSVFYALAELADLYPHDLAVLERFAKGCTEIIPYAYELEGFNSPLDLYLYMDALCKPRLHKKPFAHALANSFSKSAIYIPAILDDPAALFQNIEECYRAHGDTQLLCTLINAYYTGVAHAIKAKKDAKLGANYLEKLKSLSGKAGKDEISLLVYDEFLRLSVDLIGSEVAKTDPS